ncbi:CDP-diacylglycerol--glycerol-3-phosphate 3-phosphatidyltransferase [Treponema sp. OMZ 840]|uniref:CDP-diacylglycerol--glycerol-3-phosphate 3-phosphatidyltransferase n=1 Tax=Treponema sp. OMZ 840 TaxID=244313 RepID=UPI003D94AB3E
MKTADMLSAVRIFFAPVFFFLYFIPLWTQSFFHVSAYLLLPLLVLAEFTDFLDGFYARKHNEVSDFGKLFDPFADVFLHVTTFFCYAFSGYMPLWTLVLIIHRELGMLFVRLIAVKHGITIGAKMGGKIKTVLYIAAGMFSLVLESATRLDFTENLPMQALRAIGILLYVLCVVFAYASFIHYIISFKSAIHDKTR